MSRRIFALWLLVGCHAPPANAPQDVDAVKIGDEGKVCTLIACPDGFQLSLGSDALAVDAHTRVFGSSDGVAFECTSFPYDTERACGAQGTLRCTGAAVEANGINEADSTGACVHRLGSLRFPTQPKVVDVHLETGGASIHRLFHPTYTPRYLNGSNCDVTCTRADDDLR